MSEQQDIVRVEQVIDVGDGSGVQKFIGEGATEHEAYIDLTKKLAEAQVHATKKIREQQLTIKTGQGLIAPDKEPEIPSYSPRQLTADEQFALAQDLQDPAKLPAAIDKVIEARTGMKPEKIGELANQMATERAVRAAQQAGREWAEAHPTYNNASQQNNIRMTGYLQKHGLAVTKNNLDIAYAELSAENLLEPLPASAPEGGNAAAAAAAEPEDKETVVVRQRGATSSSLRRQHGSTQAPAPAAPKITKVEIDKMSSREYKERMKDPAFKKAVEALYTPARA